MVIYLKNKIKDKKMAFESCIHPNTSQSLDDDIMAMIPEDAFVIDERKIPCSPFSSMYVQEYAHSLGYADDKIYLIHECYYLQNQDRVYHKKGSMFNGNSKEFERKYRNMGIHISYERNPNGDADE